MLVPGASFWRLREKWHEGAHGKKREEMKGRLGIVVVDDLPEIRRLIRLELEQDGDTFDVLGEATNGREAISVVEETKPDLVLMDIDMPVMNGIEATREIRGRFPDVLVFGFTGSGDADVEAMLDAGASFVVSKDELDKLIVDLRQWMEKNPPP